MPVPIRPFLRWLLRNGPIPAALAQVAAPKEETDLDRESPGKDLGEPWREAIEYRLAMLGYALRPEVRLVALSRARTLPDIRAVYRADTLFIDSRAVQGREFRKSFLLYDLPYALIDRPLAAGTPEDIASDSDPIARDMAADYAAITRLSGSLALREWVGNEDAHRAAALLSSLTLPRLAERIGAWYGVTGGSAAFLRIVERVNRAALRKDELESGEVVGFPALPVTPGSLGRIGLSADAIRWMREHYGWIRAGDRWSGGFLPLQVLAISRGIVDPMRWLFQSGIVEAPTSAGKTLLAELRMLARRFQNTPRKKTVMLVPTREIGMERYADLRDAYGSLEGKKETERLHICYSDGEYHGDESVIWDGKFDLAIMVNEKFRHFQQSPDFLRNVGEVVFDEVTMMSEPGRGEYLEAAFTSILLTEPDIALTALSQPASGISALADAIKGVRGDAFHLAVSARPIAIEAGVWSPIDQSAQLRNCNTRATRTVTLSLDYPRDLEGTLRGILHKFVRQTRAESELSLRNNLVIAAPTKRDNLMVALALENLYHQDPDVRAILDANSNTRFIPDRLAALEPTARREILCRLLPMGIGIHDADMTAAERRLTGLCFRERELSVLICTSTMAQGVNLPAQAMVFLLWGRPVGRFGHLRPYWVNLQQDFVAWIGRVGRYSRHPHHRQAIALYLAENGPGSPEYETLYRLSHLQAGYFATRLDQAEKLPETVLYALQCLRNRYGEDPTVMRIVSFFEATPTAASAPERRDRLVRRVLDSLCHLGQFTYGTALPQLETLLSHWERIQRDGTLPETVARVRDALLSELDPEEEAVRDAVRDAADVAEPVHAGDQWNATPLRALCESPSIRAALLRRRDDGDSALSAPRCVDLSPRPKVEVQELQGLYESWRRLADTPSQVLSVTDLGRIAGSHGVAADTVLRLNQWYAAEAGGARVWDVLDILAIVLDTADGSAIQPFHVEAPPELIQQRFEAHIEETATRLGTKWRSYSPLTAGVREWSVRLKATLLAVRDWQRGRAIFVPAPHGDDATVLQRGIEQRYGLRSPGSNLYAMGRQFARLVRVFDAIGRALPPNAFPALRPEAPAASEGFVFVPYDLDAVADEIAHGMPRDAVGLSSLGIEGLSRQWILDLRKSVNRARFEPDLPLLERVTMLAQEEGALRAALPTHGLAARVSEEIRTKTRVALAAPLRQDPGLSHRWYSDPAVQAALYAQGKGRYTAIKVLHRRLYTVFRRNQAPGQPIRLESPEDVAYWSARGAVEFLSEVGKVAGEAYLLDAFLIDMDTRYGFPLDDTKLLAEELCTRLANHEWADGARLCIHWTGGSGFHIVCPFLSGAWRPLEAVQRNLQALVSRLANDRTIFLKDQPTLFEPHVMLDLSPLMRRGVYRDVFSLNSGSGNVCIPVRRPDLSRFQPEEATIARTIEILQGLNVPADANLETIISLYFEAKDEV
jgi:hypothetical protein